MRDDAERLRDMLGAIESLEKYASRGFDVYMRDELIQCWIVHHIQKIGETASRISAEMKEQQTTIPWPDIVAMRNVLVHQQFGVDLQEIWDTVSKDLPRLKSQIEETLEKLSGSPQQNRPWNVLTSGAFHCAAALNNAASRCSYCVTALLPQIRQDP